MAQIMRYSALQNPLFINEKTKLEPENQTKGNHINCLRLLEHCLNSSKTAMTLRKPKALRVVS